MLVCPYDSKQASTNFATLAASNVSYFLALNRPGTNSDAVMIGDRVLTLAAKPVPSGPLLVTGNTPLGWSKTAHRRHRGGLGFTDGHSEICDTNRLRAAFAPPAPATNWLILP